jgi:hypothetical protein
MRTKTLGEALSRLRAELAWLQARYDSGAISLAVYAVRKRLEIDISWAEHERWKWRQ